LGGRRCAPHACIRRRTEHRFHKMEKKVELERSTFENGKTEKDTYSPELIREVFGFQKPFKLRGGPIMQRKGGGWGVDRNVREKKKKWEETKIKTLSGRRSNVEESLGLRTLAKKKNNTTRHGRHKENPHRKKTHDACTRVRGVT